MINLRCVIVIIYRNLGMLETIPEVFSDARYQRCTVHFYRNIFSVTPRNKMKTVALILKAIHAQESKEAAREKAIQVAEKLRTMKLAKAARKIEDGIEETLTYMDFLRSIGHGFGPITQLNVSTVKLNAVQKRSALFRTAIQPLCSYAPDCVMWQQPAGSPDAT